jgi:hypothetical protein
MRRSGTTTGTSTLVDSSLAAFLFRSFWSLVFLSLIATGWCKFALPWAHFVHRCVKYSLKGELV